MNRQQELSVTIEGIPRPKGSGTFVTSKFLKRGKAELAWEADVKRAAVTATRGMGPLWAGDVFLTARFIFPVPKKESKRTGRFGRLLSKITHYMRRQPDLDKLLRMVGDCFTGELYMDDSQIVCYTRCSKEHGEIPRAELHFQHFAGGAFPP